MLPEKFLYIIVNIGYEPKLITHMYSAGATEANIFNCSSFNPLYFQTGGKEFGFR